jgi:tetratricopeptide (TPR) repeat protein
MMQQWLHTTKEYVSTARTWFEKALKIDPNDPDALTGDAYTHFQDFALGWADPETDYPAKILGQADRAIELAHDNVWAYYVKANYLTIIGRANEAVSSADIGLSVDPNFARMYVARASAENSLGRFEQAMSDVHQAMQLSPHDPEVGWWHGVLGIAELGLHHPQIAIDEEQRAIDGGWRPFFPYLIQSVAYMDDGKIDEGKSAMAEARRLNPELTIKWVSARWAKDPALLDTYRKAGMPEE